MPRSGLFLVLLFVWSAHAFAGEAASAKAPMSVEEMVRQDSRQAAPPQQLVWSPDGSRLIYTSSSGDLMVLEAQDGSQRVLISRDKMRVVDGTVSGREEERRARYHLRSYIWSPDSRNVLFDSRGQLWFFDVQLGVGVQLASTGGDSGWNNPQFSPNGSYLTYVRNHNLYSRGLQATDAPVRLTNSPGPMIWNGEVDWVYQEELETHSNYFWSPDSRHVAYLQTDESQVPVYPVIDWIPSHPRVDRQPYPQPGDLNPDVRVGVVGANGGKTKWLRVPIVRGEDYIPRFGWVDERTLWVEVLARDQKKRTIYFADISGDDVTPMLTQTDDKFLDDSYDVKIIAQNILLTGWQDGHSHLYLHHFDPSQAHGANTVSTQLTRGDWDVLGVAGVDLQGGIIYYLSNEGDPRQQQIWAVKMDGEGKHRISSSGAWHEPVFSRNGKYFADTVSSATIPPMAQFCRNETQCESFWKSPPSSTVRMPAIQLELKAADGATTLYGQLTLPPGNAAEHSLPLILNPYGGPGVQTVTEDWKSAGLLSDQILVTYGFAVLRVDNRGMANRGRDFAQAAFGNFGAVQLSDQLAALDQVLAKYAQLNPDRLGWWGESWGGTFTLYAMTHNSRFRAGVSTAPVTDWRDYDSIYTERYMGDPAANPTAYADYSVNESAKNLHGHLLLLQGTEDDNVHFSNAIQFAQKLNDANLSYDLQLYPGATHAFSGAETTIRVYHQVLDHFARYVRDSRDGIDDGVQKAHEGESAP